jgi:hypothetical protein
MELRPVDLNDQPSLGEHEVGLLAPDSRVDARGIDASVVKQLERPALGVGTGAGVRDRRVPGREPTEHGCARAARVPLDACDYARGGGRLQPYRFAEGAAELLFVKARGQIQQDPGSGRDRQVLAPRHVAVHSLRPEDEHATQAPAPTLP